MHDFLVHAPLVPQLGIGVVPALLLGAFEQALKQGVALVIEPDFAQTLVMDLRQFG
jgi:hypothetical protein